jgi:inner membrane protein
MTWKSHIAIATAVTIPFNPTVLPYAILGSTAPDWSEYILKFFGIHVEHRGFTHYMYIPFIFIVIGLFFHDYVFWFGVGYFSHWFADSLTKSGVPLSQFDTHRVHFFGGKITTGEPLEYIIAYSFLAISVIFVKPNLDLISDLVTKKEEQKIIKYNPYYNDYRDLYKKEIIDPKTMKENRFKLF